MFLVLLSGPASSGGGGGTGFMEAFKENPTFLSINFVVSGFCKEVLRELPMEFAVEAQNLLSVSLEGAVG